MHTREFTVVKDLMRKWQTFNSIDKYMVFAYVMLQYPGNTIELVFLLHDQKLAV